MTRTSPSGSGKESTLRPWWLRPTAESEGENEPESEAPRAAAEPAAAPPAETPAPFPPGPSADAPAPESAPPSPPLYQRPGFWQEEEPAPAPAAGFRSASVWEPAPLLPEEAADEAEETEEEPVLAAGYDTGFARELEAEDDDDTAALAAEAGAFDPAEAPEDTEFVAAEADGAAEAGREETSERRRRSRRGRGRRKGRTATPEALEPEEDEEDDEALAFDEPLPIAPQALQPAARRRETLRPGESFYVGPDVESVAREIVVTLPERPRASDERKIALFCDLENIALGVRDSEVSKFDINMVLERLLEKGKIIVKKAYADWERYSEYKRPFHEAAIELIDIPQKYYSGKNSADIKMVVDAMDLSYSKEHLDTFVLLSGDSDFSPLVSKLKENNKYVIGIGVKNSSSNLLVDNCDEFIYYEDVWRDTARGPQLSGLTKKQTEVFGLMVESIQALSRENKDVLWGSMIKQTMQRKKPSFNEGYYGYSTFSELLEDAERKNIVKLKKDQRSGTYIVTGFAKQR